MERTAAPGQDPVILFLYCRGLFGEANAVWPRIIYITVIAFYSMRKRHSVLNRVFGNVAAIGCISCSSEGRASKVCLHTGRIFKKQLLLMESGPINNQVSCFWFSGSARLVSY